MVTGHHARRGSPHNGTSHIPGGHSGQSTKPSSGCPELVQPNIDADRTAGPQTGSVPTLRGIRTASNGDPRVNRTRCALPPATTRTQGDGRLGQGCWTVHVPHRPSFGHGKRPSLGGEGATISSCWLLLTIGCSLKSGSGRI